MSKRLLDVTRDLANATEISDRDLGKAIDMTPGWVRLFRAGDMKSPGVEAVQRLYEFLTKMPLLKD